MYCFWDKIKSEDSSIEHFRDTYNLIIFTYFLFSFELETHSEGEINTIKVETENDMTMNILT